MLVGGCTGAARLLATAAAADRIIERIGKLAILYYPEFQIDRPDHSLDHDVSWVLEGSGTIASDAEVRELVARVILDPTTARDEFVGTILYLVDH